jgi:hypothetical protein
MWPVCLKSICYPCSDMKKHAGSCYSVDQVTCQPSSPNTAHGCSRQGVAVARLTSVRPRSILALSKTFTVLAVGLQLQLQSVSSVLVSRTENTWWCVRRASPLTSLILRPGQQLASHLILTMLYTAAPYFPGHGRCQSNSPTFRRVDKRKKKARILIKRQVDLSSS